MTGSPNVSRRMLLGTALSAGAASMWATPTSLQAQSGGAVNFTAWSAAVDQVKSHISAFENASKLKVNYENFPWAQYRTSVVTRLVGNAPMDVLWVSDAWLPEFAEAQWLANIDDIPELMKYNADAAPYCTQSMTYKGKQYGLSYYGDHMSFVYNTDILQRAGIDKPPATWDEVVQASLKIKQAGIVEYPLLLALGDRHLARRVHERDGLLEWRTLCRPAGCAAHGGAGPRCDRDSGVDPRCDPYAQDCLARGGRNARNQFVEGIRCGPARLLR